MAYIYAYAPDEDDCSTIGLVGALLDEGAEFNIKAGDSLLILGEEGRGIAVVNLGSMPE